MRQYTDCIVPEPGHRNQNGYIRVLDKPRKDGGRLVMLHRMEWERVNGPILSGYEVNHKCKNRECCNTNHLEVLTRSEHRSKDNTGRYADRAAAVVKYKLENPLATQREVAAKFNISQSGVSQIIRRTTHG